MRLLWAGVAPVLLMLPVAGGAEAAEAIKSGRWEFTSQMQMPNMPQLPPGVALPPGMQMQPGGGMSVNYTHCVDPNQAVPTDPRRQCRVERTQRSGGTVSWTTTCTTGQGTVRSEGLAHYVGDTMEATLTTQIPQADGRTMQTQQRISGRYLGPCAR